MFIILPFGVEAASVEVDTVDELVEAVKIDGEIVIKNDLDLSSVGITIDKDVTIDLNGNTITTSNTDGGIIYVGYVATVIIEDSIGSGEISSLTDQTGGLGVIDVKGTLIVNSGSIISKYGTALNVYNFDTSSYPNEPSYVSTVIINGGTISGSDDDRHAAIANVQAVATMGGASLIIVNDGDVSAIRSAYTGNVFDHDISINGGNVGIIKFITSTYAYDYGVIPALNVSGGNVGAITLEVNGISTDELASDYFDINISGGSIIVPEEDVLVNEDTLEGFEISSDNYLSVIANTLSNNSNYSKLIVGHTDVKVDITLEEITLDNTTEEIKNAIEAIEDETDLVVESYFDINLLLSSNELTDSYNITELEDTISLKVLMPEATDSLEDGYLRTYYILRYHDGVVDTILGTISEDGKYIEFETDRFSVYALSYEDTIEVTEDLVNPETFDSVMFYFIISSISLVAIIGISYKLRRN